MGGVILGAITLTASCKDYDDDINNLERNLDSNVTSLTQQLQTVRDDAQTNLNNLKTELSGDISKVQAQATENGDSIANLLRYHKADAAAAVAAQNTADQAIDSIAGHNATLAQYGYNYQTFVAATNLLQSNLQDLKKEDVTRLQEAVNALWGAVTNVDVVGTIGTYWTSTDNISSVPSQNHTYGSYPLFDSKGDPVLDTDGNQVYMQSSSLYVNSEDLQYYNKNLNGQIPVYGWVYSSGNVTLSGAELNYFNSVVPTNNIFGRADEGNDGNVYGNASPEITYTKGDAIHDGTVIVVRVNPVNARITKDMVKIINSQGDDLSNYVVVDSVKPFTGLMTRAGIASGLWSVYTSLKDDLTDTQYAKIKTSNGNSILYSIAINNTENQYSDRYVISDYNIRLGNNVTNYRSYSYTDITYAKLNYKDRQQYVDNSQALSIEDGESFTMDFSGYGAVNFEAYYVALDKNASKEDTAKWNKYTYTGLNNIVRVDKGRGLASISVTLDDKTTNDNVQFRVFAVKKTGEVVNYPFTVYVHKANHASASGDVAIISSDNTKNTTGWIPLEGTLTGTTAPNASYSSTINGVDFTYSLAADEKGAEAKTYADAKYIKFTINDTPSSWADTKTLNGNITIGENVINVTLKKVLNVKADAKVTWKANTLDKDGVYTAYLYPNNGYNTEASYGYLDLSGALTTEATDLVGSVDGISNNKARFYNLYTEVYDKALVDGKTAHTAHINQRIYASSVYDNLYPVDTFKIVFKDIIDEFSYKVDADDAAKTALTLTWNQSPSANILDHVTFTNAKNTTMNGKASSVIPAYFIAPESDAVALTSNSTKKADYFTATYSNGVVTLTPVAGAHNPTADVASTLTITLKDAFGHTTTVSVPVTVKRVP